MAIEWPNLSSFSGVTIMSSKRAGTIETAGSYGAMGAGAQTTVQYQATTKKGLIKNSASNTYQVVQVWVRGSSTAGVTYEKLIHKPSGTSGTCSFYVRTYANYVRWSNGFNLNAPRSDYKTESGRQIVGTDKLVCYKQPVNSILYLVNNKPSVSWTSDKYYYKVSSGKWEPLTIYVVKEAGPAGAWVAAARKGLPSASTNARSDTSVFATALDPLDRLSGNLGTLRAEMQAVLDRNGSYRTGASYAARGGSSNINQDLQQLVTKILTERGYGASDIAWFINPTSTPAGFQSRAGTAGGGGGTRTPGAPTSGNGSPTNQRPTPDVAPTPAVTKVVVRAPFGYSKPPSKAPDTRPQIVQNYVDYVKDASTVDGYKERSGQDIFHFPYTPNNISYSGLGSEWTNIDRQGNYPLVEWAKWQLMRVEIEFLLAEDRVVPGGAKVPDGIYVSVQNRLNTLRRMSQRQAAVSVFNLDDLFRVQVRRAAKTGKPMQFVIADLNVTATRRSMDSIEKEITAATVKLTLQEIPIENVTIVKMSPPKLTDPVIPKRKEETVEEINDPLWWSGVENKL